MNKMNKNIGIITLFMLPALVIYSMALPIPIFKTIYFSFQDWNIIGDKQFIGWDNYVEMFYRDPIFIITLKNTVLFTLACTVLQLPLAFLFAHILAGRMKGAKWFRNIFFLPAIISGTAVGLLWQFIYHSEIGLINGLIQLIGFESFDKAWLSDQSFAIFAVAIAVSWQFCGYHMVIYLAGMSTVSEDVMEAARMDGASSSQILFRIIVPLMKPFITISLILSATGSVKAFDNVIALTGGGPAHASDVMALHMYNTSFLQMRYGYGSAIAVILLLLNVVLSLAITMAMRERKMRRTNHG